MKTLSFAEKGLGMFLLALASLSNVTQAALVDRGGGLIYDTVQDITWLKDANYAQTSGYDADGKMTWFQAQAWVGNLSYFDSVRNVSYADWRLASWTDTGASGPQWGLKDTDSGYNVDPASSELAHLWHVSFENRSFIGPNGEIPQLGWGLRPNPTNLADESLFMNIQRGIYWMGTDGPTSTHAWTFDADQGRQEFLSKWSDDYFVWAVRDGDVASLPSNVPESMPTFVLVFALSAIGLARRQAR